MPDVKEEIKAMLEAFEPKATDEKVDEKDEKPDDNQEDKTDEEEDTNGDQNKEEETDEETDDTKTDTKTDEKDKIIKALEERLAKLEEATKNLKEEPKEEEPKEKELKFDPQDFIGDADVEEIVRDKESLNKLLNNVYTKAVGDARNMLGEKVLRSIPDIVKTNINIMTKLKEASEKFYDDNKDLKPFKKVVASVFEELTSKNPDKTYEDLLTEVGNEARKRLDLQKKAIEKEKGTPKLPSKKGNIQRDSKKPDTSPIQSEIDTMNKSLGRK
jgi:hypothetical protein